MATFAPQAHDTGRCAECGALRSIHRREGKTWYCPQMYRPDTLERAMAALRDARARGDAAAEFVARGEVQRLGGNPDDA